MRKKRRCNEWRIVELGETGGQHKAITVIDLTSTESKSPLSGQLKLDSSYKSKLESSYPFSKSLTSIDELSKRFGQLLCSARSSLNSFLESSTKQCCEVWNKIVKKENEIDGLLKRRQLSKNNFPKIPNDFASVIEAAVGSAESPDYILTVGRCCLSFNELDRLDGPNWLNDQIIDGYLYLIGARSMLNENYPKVYSFNSYFYNSLNSPGGYSNVSRFTTKWKVDIFAHDVLFFPICTGTHWSLGCVDVKAQIIAYYDSLDGHNLKFFTLAKEFLRAESEKASSASKPDTAEIDQWTCRNAAEIPLQKNGFDCGLFVCIYAEYLSRGEQFDFDQSNMPYFRDRVKYELFSNRLLIV